MVNKSIKTYGLNISIDEGNQLLPLRDWMLSVPQASENSHNPQGVLI